jgi:serine/threonine-protein kinase
VTFDFEAELRAALGPSYEIERELTGSGMSRVFVALERELNRRVVIKVLPPELAAGVNRERFRREIQLAAQLQHPHIVPLHAAGARGDLLYFTMPFIEGESLRHALVEGQRFSVREVVRILHNVSDALAYAHTRGVIHRDIKPGNVLRSGAHALVTDFGVAKAISAALPAVGMTTSGMAIGTPQYMAPEQLAGDPAADHRVDIYALGLLAYELLAGEAPFKAPSPQETMAAQLTRAPEPIGRRRGDIRRRWPSSRCPARTQPSGAIRRRSIGNPRRH